REIKLKQDKSIFPIQSAADQELFDRFHLAYLRFSGAGVILNCNTALLTLLGLPSESTILGTSLGDSLFTEDFAEELSLHLSARDFTSEIFETTVNCSKTGLRSIILTVSKTESESGMRVYEALLQDVTHLRIKQKIRTHVKTIESSATLARRASHEISNKLTAVLGYSELALIKISPTEKAFTYIETVRKSAKNTLETVHELKKVYALHEYSPMVLELREMLDTEVTRLRARVSSKIKIEFSGPKSTKCTIFSDSKAVKYSFDEIIANALDAMPDGGTISVIIKSEMLHSSNRLHLLPGKYIILQISNSGAAIQTDLRDRIFEPFYSTKEYSIVDGIGLSLVERTMHLAGGRVVLTETAAGETCFSLYFPHYQKSRGSVS
ncbi:MAG: HAMP domain-containing histidine kinase, partial [FCB group bacterium]|nr:HAMP domain-containing histidine kinase [FCB group bacterium]